MISKVIIKMDGIECPFISRWSHEASALFL